MFVSFLDKEDGNKPTINSVKKVCDKSNLLKGLRAYSKFPELTSISIFYTQSI